MLVWSLAISGFYWCIVLASVTFVTVDGTIYGGGGKEELFRTKVNDFDTPTDDATRNKRSTETVRKLLHSTEGFLAGEDTPVWIAYRAHSDKPVSYNKLEMGIVKKAISYWKSNEFKGLTTRARRSIDEGTNFAKKLWYSITQSASESGSNAPDEESINKREEKIETRRWSGSLPKVLYPSVLIMMDYKTDWPVDETNQQKLIYERILYALAFWNGVDLQLRHIRNPKVRLRVAGIIIGRNKEATPYLRENEGWIGLKVGKAYRPMVKYWRDMATVNADFPKRAYSFIATMTDSRPGGGFFHITHGIASVGPPCYSSEEVIGGLIFPDDLAFGGIQAAVHETAHMLGAAKHDGDSMDCPAETGNVLSFSISSLGRKWSACSLQQISTALTVQGWCLEKPKEYHPPGEPVETILPGKLMPASKQCQARGWGDGNVCWQYVTCEYLYCSNNRWSSTCRSSGAATDGTTCGTSQMCLDGKCVSNTTMT